MTSFTKALAAILGALLLLDPVCGSNELKDTQFHRSLAGYVLPFEIEWRFVIADIEGVPPDRQPTQAEYEGIRQATIDWFTVEIPLAYQSTTDFSFREVDCEIAGTEYDPDEEWVHEILLNCEVIWDADAIEDTPDVVKFLTDMNADNMLDSFVESHLRGADPQNPRNIFQFSQRVGYITEDNGTRGPLTTTEQTTAPAPTAAPPTMAPTTTTTTPAPSTSTTTPAPSPSPGPQTPMPTDLPKKKVAPAAKCGSLASTNGRGGAAADAKGCISRLLAPGDVGGGRRKRRKLKGSSS